MLTKVSIIKAMVFPVVMYRWESWMIHWRIGASELWCWRRLSRVPWTARRSNQSILMNELQWIFIGVTDAKAEAPIFWPCDMKSQLIGKDLDPGKDWRQKEKGVSEDKMVKWHHWFNGHEFEQTPGNSGGQGSLVCCSPWGHKESNRTERLNNNWHHRSGFQCPLCNS